MAKNFNSFSFTILVLVLMMASTGVLKSQALPGMGCPPGNGACPYPHMRMFLGECGPIPFIGTDWDCCACCFNKYGSPPVCWAVVEGDAPYCHCYQKAF